MGPSKVVLGFWRPTDTSPEELATSTFYRENGRGGGEKERR
jgi:hypothetical protein